MKSFNIYSPDSVFLQLEEDGLYYADSENYEVIEEYLKLRKEVFEDKPATAKIPEFIPDCNYGLDTHIITVSDKEKKCVGGAVIVIKDKEEGLLPLENKSLDLKKTFPELDLQNKIYACFSDFVIDPQHRDWRCSANIFRCIHNLCVSKNVRYLFGTAPEIAARRNVIGLERLKVGVEAKIMRDIELPYDEMWNGYPRVLLLVDINPRYENIGHEFKNQVAS